MRGACATCFSLDFLACWVWFCLFFVMFILWRMPCLLSAVGIFVFHFCVCVICVFPELFAFSREVDFDVPSSRFMCLCVWQRLLLGAALSFTFAPSLRCVQRAACLSIFGWILWIYSVLVAGLVSPRSTLTCCPGPNYCIPRFLPEVQEGANTFCITGTNPLWFPSYFDDSLGFPGEGPGPTGHATLSVVTANIGSLKKNNFWSTCGDDIICIQETRTCHLSSTVEAE